MSDPPDHRELLAAADFFAPTIRRIVQTLHATPETGLQEVAAAALLGGILSQEGFLLETGLAGMPTAFAATSGASSPRIGLIAEMDALPGLGHACGHNIIAAAAVGAGLILKRVLSAEAASIVVFGTPAEELGIGKIDMIKAGCFERIDFAMMVHPSSRRQVIKQFLGLAKIRFTFHGRPAHAAAYPEDGVNALDAVIQTFNAINAMRQQLRQDVRVHGIITDGGSVPNIIPAKASCYFYVRADDLPELAKAKDKLLAAAKGAATSSGCRLEMVEEPRTVAPLKINRAFSRLYSQQLAVLGLREATADPGRNKGSSDIGNLSQLLPVIHPHVPIGDGINIHTQAFAMATVSPQGEAAALEGATALAMTAVQLIYSPAWQEEIRQEFHEGN